MIRPDKRSYLALLAVFAVFAVGCQKKSDGDSTLGRLLMLTAASTRVTANGGGTIQQPTMSLTVPQGALEEDTEITVSRIGLPDAQGSSVPVQAAYEFGPENLQFNKPATLKICYDAVNLIASGYQEKTLQVQYHDPDSGEFISMGGDVDLVNHCVSAPIYHFSSYILTAQLLAIGNNAPTIGGASFFPGTPIAGLPVTVRSSVTDWDAGSAIATVRLFYRTAGSGGIFKTLTMLPEQNDATGQFYTAKIPQTDVTASGFEYYIQAFDSLNSGRTNPATAPATFSTIAGDTPDGTTPIRFQATVSQMSAGFSRDLTVQVKGSSAATFFPVPADTLTFAGGKGTTSRPTWLSARYTAEKIGSSFLQAAYGSLNLSVPLSVYPGNMVRIDVLYNDAVLPDPLNVDGNSVTQLDAAGYDQYNNFMFVQPVFSTTGGIGTFGDAANYGKLIAANVFPDTSGTITATLGGYSISYNVLVHTTWVLCQFDVGLFDAACVFN
ncbi:MAG: hypothetical protein K8S54_05330 [Spirochaetia bacterium]|nr:hypothetical protein [Spirochaetia bacterium]